MIMRRILIVLPCLSLVLACGTTMPKELRDARTQYTSAANGPAATQAPAQLHVAKTALDDAERAYADGAKDQVIRDKAYVAERKAQLADTAARVEIAQREQQAAELEAQRMQASNLQRAQQELTTSQRSLAKTQTQLESERAARVEAEQKQAKALADLEKIAAVKQEPRGMVITLSGSVLFATDQSTLLPAAQTKLNEVAEALTKGDPDSPITVEGHTDSQGTHDHNMLLAQRRAESVKAQLVARGVASDRIRAVGIGPDRPIANNKSPEGRANNRRVEIIIGKSGDSEKRP
jgi:outer membrane protein OmpA-like peptidoglycan-associated protein